MIDLRLMGPVSLTDGSGRPLDTLLAHPKLMGVLAYLVLDGFPDGYVQRDTLLATFWPEADEQHARHALRQALYRIEQELGAGMVVRRGRAEVGVDPGRLQCDVSAFREMRTRGRLKGAYELYRGELLSGFHIPGAPEFERWLSRERERVREEVASVTWALTQKAERKGDAVSAARWARRTFRLSREDEAVLRRVMELLDSVGDRSAALRLYEEFARELSEEYDAEPAPQTRALVRQLRHRT